MKITESLIKIRKERNKSQTQIAELLETTQQQYSKYETGAQAIPVIHIIKLCKEYNVTADELLGIKAYMNSEEGNKKFYKLYDEIIDILYWAEGQGHITEDQKELLIENLISAKADIENE